MKNFAIFMHPAFCSQNRIFDLLTKLSAEHGIVFMGSNEQRKLLPSTITCYPLEQNDAPAIDCVLVFGGDGTILRAKEIALATGAPILGVNLGYLGFLSESTLTELQGSISQLLQQRYKLLQRMLLSCNVRRRGKIIYQASALNDAVIYKAETPRLIHVRLYDRKRFVLDTRCDGVIVSTPTGSTAYSLSAGGPILSPEMQAIIFSPLSPHILSIRPMVFNASDKLMMKVYGLERDAWLQIDGINSLELQENDEVLVTASKQSVAFIKLTNRTFYKILRNKLHLGR